MDSHENKAWGSTVLQGFHWLYEESALIMDNHFAEVTGEKQRARIISEPRASGIRS